jgi:hypothetical protein
MTEQQKYELVDQLYDMFEELRAALNGPYGPELVDRMNAQLAAGGSQYHFVPHPLSKEDYDYSGEREAAARAKLDEWVRNADPAAVADIAASLQASRAMMDAARASHDDAPMPKPTLQ